MAAPPPYVPQAPYRLQQQAPPAPLQGHISGRPMFGQVDLNLGAGQTVIADAGSLTWMDGDMPAIETSVVGGCFQGCARSCSGEHCCLNTYTGPGRVGFAFPLPGDIEAFTVTKEYGWVLSRGAFICGTSNLQVSAKMSLCGSAAGEGLFLTKVTVNEGSGMFFAGGFGSIKRHDIPVGQVFFVDNGMFFATSVDTKMRLSIVGGDFKAMCCSGEGLVLRFTGPCTVYTQSRDPSLFKPPMPMDPNAPEQ